MINQDQINQEPIFIVGFPRSGTTFLQSLLCTQKGIVSFPETHFFNKAVGHYPNNHLLSKDELKKVAEVLEQKINFNFDVDRIKTTSNELILQKNVFESWLIQLAEWQKVDLTDENTFWLEKTPAHGMFLNKILDYYPKAKVIAMMRNPLFSIDSYYNKLVDYRKPYHDLAEEWKTMYESIEAVSKTYSDQILTVKYEDVVQSEGEEMKRIGQFIGREINLELLSNYSGEAKKLIVDNEPWKENNTKSSKFEETKKHSIPVKNILQIEYLLKPFFEKYNYPIEHGGLLSVYSKYRKMRS